MQIGKIYRFTKDPRRFNKKGLFGIALKMPLQN